MHNKPKQQNDPQCLGLPHTANWSLVPACQHILCIVFVVCSIPPPPPSCGLAGCLGSRTALFRAEAEPASVCFDGKQTHHWKICHVRFFCPFSIPYYLFPPYYSLAVHWNVALLSKLQSRSSIFLVNVWRQLQELFCFLFYSPAALKNKLYVWTPTDKPPILTSVSLSLLGIMGLSKDLSGLLEMRKTCFSKQASNLNGHGTVAWHPLGHKIMSNRMGQALHVNVPFNMSMLLCHLDDWVPQIKIIVQSGDE